MQHIGCAVLTGDWLNGFAIDAIEDDLNGGDALTWIAERLDECGDGRGHMLTQLDADIDGTRRTPAWVAALASGPSASSYACNDRASRKLTAI